VEPGERVGLVGVNGSGKSTLARVLAGAEPVDAGELAWRRGARIEYLEQAPSFPDDARARDVVATGLGSWLEAKARHERLASEIAAAAEPAPSALEALSAAAADVERLGGWERGHEVERVMMHVGVTAPDACMGTLSGGERRRVALARVLVSRPDLMILDEPSNHLDAETIEWLERHLIEEQEGAVLLITHDRYLLDRVAERTLEIDRGKLTSYDGGYEAYLEAKAERQALAARTEANRQNFLRRELEWLRRQPKARTGKQKARIGRAEAARSARPARAERTVELGMTATVSGKVLFELSALRLAYGPTVLVAGLDLVVTQGERIGIVGRNGAGKTSLLRALSGELAPAGGKIVRGKGTRIAYLDQERRGLDPAASVTDNVSGGASRVTLGSQVLDVRSYLERFLFDATRQRQPVGSLSGGERARVALAKMLLEPASLLMLDEPTNDLDTATLAALEEMLLDMQATALVVTHDRYFLDRVATAILAFEGEGRVVRYAGNYDSYLGQRPRPGALSEPPPAAASAPPKAPAPARTPKAAGLTYAERLELEGLLERVAAAEEAVTALEARLSDPSGYGSGLDIAKLGAELARARVEAERLTTRWEELETRREAAGRPSA
ncbi:MAG: ABC-F family ATP-binding cassette domain-containing protein, partial [Polyangiaceae bacterium]|nr:ABC-F family ATP-binding cassette domain-containing protein [Polyangiaceae bacterium]